jgi:MFS family permease
MVSKSVPEGSYGTALGIYNTAQYLGSSIGGPVAGALSHFSRNHMMATLMVSSAVGVFLMLALKPPRDQQPVHN